MWSMGASCYYAAIQQWLELASWMNTTHMTTIHLYLPMVCFCYCKPWSMLTPCTIGLHLGSNTHFTYRLRAPTWDVFILHTVKSMYCMTAYAGQLPHAGWPSKTRPQRWCDSRIKKYEKRYERYYRRNKPSCFKI